MLRWWVGTMLAFGLLAAPAHAIPGDPPFAPLEPADGAALPVDPGGIPVSLVGQFTTQIGKAALTRIRVAPDGSFVGAATTRSASIRVRGKLSGRRLKGGRVELSVGSCQGSSAFAAKRTR